MVKRASLSIALTLALILSAAAPAAEPLTIDIPDSAPPEAPAADVAAPPNVDADDILPHEGEKLRRARMPLDDILAAIDQPAFAGKAIDDEKQTGDPPLAAQTAYVTGRQAWLDGRNFEATRQLEMAHRLAPNEPEILRLLARTNAIKAADHLRRALELDPADLSTAFDLGRLQLDQRRWPEAIATLAHAQSLQGREEGQDPVRLALIHFYLGNALKQEGYDAAAITHLMKYLEAPEYGNFASPLGHLFQIARRQSGLMWQTVGDARNRLLEPAEALDAYRKAADEGVTHELGLVSRLTYTLLRLGRTDDAQKVAVDYLGGKDVSPRAFELAGYLRDNGVDGAQLAERIRPIYLAAERPAQLAMLIAEMSPPDEALTFLQQHMTEKPHDRLVFAYFLRKHLDADGKLSPQAAAVVLDIVANSVAAVPGSGSQFIEGLFAAFGDPKDVEAAIAALPEDRRQNPVIRYLDGMAKGMRGESAEAMKIIEAVVADAPDLAAARVTLARLYMGKGDVEKAAAILAPLEDGGDAQIGVLRAGILARSGKLEEAISLLDKLIENGVDREQLVIEKSRLQLQSGDAVAAERTLEDALAVDPKAEAIYEELFDLYNRSDIRLPDQTKQYERLMWRMLGAIPDSRLARLKLAEQYMTSERSRAAAEQLLRGLLDENPRDFQAMYNLVELLYATERIDEALKFLGDRIEANPKDAGVVGVAMKFYLEHLVRPGVNAEQQEKLLLILPPSQLRTLELSRIYASSDRHEQAIDMLKELDPDGDEVGTAIARVGVTLGGLDDEAKMDELFKQYIAALPDLDAELRFWWAYAYEQKGQRDRSVAIHRENLKLHPDHAQTANTLGYLWAYEGTNLDEAKELIKRAVDADPNNGAYLDSLGWVHYKQGNFEEAVTWLKRASTATDGEDAIIYDHVGDALFRKGDRDGAIDYWQRAMRLYRPSSASQSSDPERKSLGERLRLKLNAMRSNSKPPLADVPGVEDGDGQVDPDAAQAPAPAPDAAPVEVD